MSLLDPDLLNSRNPRLFAILSGARPAARISTGIYSVATFNFNLLLSSDWDDFPNDLPGGLEGYGVVDSVEQFIDRFWGALSDDPHGYCVAFTRVRKSEQPAEGGWRWCKWGPYLGAGSPQCDYLHDEPHFSEVFCFHVFRHKSWRLRLARGTMTDSSRPPAFKIPSPKTAPLFLFFGKGDYVVARSANEAACLWMDHFDDLGYAWEFQQLANSDPIDIYLDSDDTACTLTPMTLADLDSERARCQSPEINTWSAAELVERFGLGYLASTEE